jgi:hypothetical protein
MIRQGRRHRRRRLHGGTVQSTSECLRLQMRLHGHFNARARVRLRRQRLTPACPTQQWEAVQGFQECFVYYLHHVKDSFGICASLFAARQALTQK